MIYNVTELVFATDLGDARLVFLLFEVNSGPVGQKGHVGVVQLDGLAVCFQCLRKALIEREKIHKAPPGRMRHTFTSQR